MDFKDQPEHVSDSIAISPLQLLFQKLTGQEIPHPENISILTQLGPDKLELGYSQLNELLLFLGYDRISISFFQFLVDGSIEYSGNSVINNIRQLEKQINKIVEFSLRLFGNIKFGYKQLSTESNEQEFIKWYEAFQPTPESHYTSRHSPLFELNRIPDDETYYLGYVIGNEIEQRLDKNQNDSEAIEMKKKQNETIVKGIKNQMAYLASDHMDVYVATSMRQRHEYLFISRVTSQIFEHPDLKNLKVRYFDPTQAYCFNRIDKGIAEALMLKRANCTIYLAQESDTLGKDSELASTLAQGKTVIAYIPNANKKYVDDLISDISLMSPNKSRKEIIIDQLKIFNSDLCWNDKNIRNWVDEESTNEEIGLEQLYLAVQKKYDIRAQTLKDIHPLGIQVNLETGVANGVIVCREIDECALVVRQVLLKKLDFKVVEEIKQDKPYTLLKESLTGSVYRVSTGDRLLANAFWNFYLPK